MMRTEAKVVYQDTNGIQQRVIDTGTVLTILHEFKNNEFIYYVESVDTGTKININRNGTRQVG